MTSRALVAIKRVTCPIQEASLVSNLAEAMSLAGFEIRAGDNVVIKPNIFAPTPPPVTTDPRVIGALVHLALESGAREVVVAEGRSISTAKFRKGITTTRGCAKLLGITEVVESAGGRMVYMEEGGYANYVDVAVPRGQVLERAKVARAIVEAGVLINVPVMKIHSLTLVTLGIKNLHGCLSDEDKLYGHSYHELPEKLVDFLEIRKPDFTVVDGIVGGECDHADYSRPVDMGLVIAGKDVVAVDAVALAVMGFDPMEIDTTRIACDRGLGEGNLTHIKVLGEKIESVRRVFTRPDIALDVERFPGLRIIAGDYCRSCEYYIRRGLDKLLGDGILDGQRDLTIVMGKEPPVPENIPGEGMVIMIGDCCVSSRSVRRFRDRMFLQGRLGVIYACPPMEFRIRATELVMQKRSVEPDASCE